ncbi:helix-turn-helix domain-containing protein [Dyella silvae]|uniref:helix-turn-helix domain-containing protein n=1 Tax=Dyella silvae TaxID=2994424 RepID=UPI00226444A7|nr:helix-turn-helix domain-containing protein [Dyella silvae]
MSSDACAEGRQCAFSAGNYVASRGERLTDVFMIRKGVIKTRLTTKDGRERITNFHFPGELVGLEAVHSGRHVSEIVALQYSECCRLSFDQLVTLAERNPLVQRQLLSLMSEQLNRSNLVAGDLTAEERVAVFLLDIRSRLTMNQPAQQGFHLVMSRADIANYLRLSAETVSRILTRFRRRGWIDIAGRNLRSMEKEPLERLSREASVCE